MHRPRRRARHPDDAARTCPSRLRAPHTVPPPNSRACPRLPWPARRSKPDWRRCEPGPYLAECANRRRRRRSVDRWGHQARAARHRPGHAMPATAQFELPSSQHRLGHQSRRIPSLTHRGELPFRVRAGDERKSVDHFRCAYLAFVRDHRWQRTGATRLTTGDARRDRRRHVRVPRIPYARPPVGEPAWPSPSPHAPGTVCATPRAGPPPPQSALMGTPGDPRDQMATGSRSTSGHPTSPPPECPSPRCGSTAADTPTDGRGPALRRCRAPPTESSW